METQSAMKFASLLKCVYNHTYTDESSDAKLFADMEHKELQIKESVYDPYKLVLYHQQLDTVRHKVIGALIHALNILLERREKQHVLDKVYHHIANARVAFNRYELSLVIQRALESFSEFGICTG
jgi:hypothetical protein